MKNEQLIAHNKPRSPISEAYRMVRTNVQFTNIDSNITSIVVTSPTLGEGKSTTVANLATIFAQAGKRVIIVDCDLRKPTQHDIFGIKQLEGLTTALLGEKPLASIIVKTCIEGLDVLPAGPIPPNPAEILSSNLVKSLFEELESYYDVVLVDTPPLLAVTDAAILAGFLDGTILVLSSGGVKKDLAIQARENLLKVKANILGAVLNKVTSETSGYYYYNQYYQADAPTVKGRAM